MQALARGSASGALEPGFWVFFPTWRVSYQHIPGLYVQ